MPLKAEFDSENRILRFHLEGTVTDESLNECYREIGKYAALTAPSTGILDLSKVTSLEVSAEPPRRPHGKRGFRDPGHPSTALRAHAIRVTYAPAWQGLLIL